MSVEPQRTDGFRSHEDAAAGYERWVGVFRVAMREACYDLREGRSTAALVRLREALRAYDWADRERREANRATLNVAGLDYAPDGRVIPLDPKRGCAPGVSGDTIAP